MSINFSTAKTGRAGSLRETILFVALFAILLAVAIAVRVRGGEIDQRSPDENTYMYYANIAATQPFEAPRQIVQTYNETPEMWFYPSALRFVYYEGIAGLEMGLHETTEEAGLQLSVFFSLLQWACVAAVGFRFFNRWVVLAALGFLSFSPPDLLMTHRVWGDELVGGAGMCLVWIAVESAMRPRDQWWFAGLLCFSVFFMLLKETAGFFCGPCVAAAIWCKVRGPDFSWERTVRLCAAAAAAPVAVFVIVAVMCGGADAVIAVARHDAEGLAGNHYAMTFQNGPWYSIPIIFWMLAPVPALLCLLGMGGAFWMQWRNRKEGKSGQGTPGRFVSAMSLLAIAMIAMDTLKAGLMNIRYLSFILGPCCLVSAYGLMIAVKEAGRLFPQRARAMIPVIAAVIVMASCWLDYARYRNAYVAKRVGDLTVQSVIQTSSIKWLKDAVSMEQAGRPKP